MNAAAIIAIPDSEPERLFKVPGSIKADYHALAMFWHPDRNSDARASDVLARITALYKMAQEKVAKGIWHPPGLFEVTGSDGKRRSIRYRARRTFELGEMLIGMSLVTFIIPKQYENLVLAGLKCVGSMRYPNDRFRLSLEPHLPKVEKMFDGADKSTVICVRKRPDEILLADLIKHMGGSIPPKHAAWIISSLLNLACYLQISKMTVNGLSPSTVFVSPQKHAVSLYGGWWYAAPTGKPITALSPETFPLASRKLRTGKIAGHELDMESIKAIGRACLGDISGGSFRTRADLPAPFTQFLQLPATKPAVVEYENWPKILEASFGPRRFHELNISGTDVYPDGEN
jgi:hypothetical protein